MDHGAAGPRGRQRTPAAGLQPHRIRSRTRRRSRHPVLGLELRRRAAGRIPRAGLDRSPRTAARRRRPRAQRGRAADLAVPARPAHRCVRRPDPALPGLSAPEAGPAMTGPDHPLPTDGMPAGQPIARVRRGDVDYVLLGTAHVSRVSAAAVTAMLEAEPFDAVAVELCEPRYTSMRDPDAFRHLDLFQVIRQGKVGLIAANLALSAFQRRLAEQFGIE